MVVANKAEEEPNFSDPEDYIDEISNEDLLPDLMRTEPRLDKSIDKIIVIDNIPKVGDAKKEKLKQIINKVLVKYGPLVNEYFPEDANGVTKGYMFAEFTNEQSASDAQQSLNGYALDKNHIFRTNSFKDFETYQNLDINPPSNEAAPYTDPGNLMWWLTTPECYDQYAVLHGDNYTSVCLNTPLQPTILESRDKWTPTRFQWSPRGTYLATFHDKGIALWAGEKFKQFMRFSHSGVQLIDFSPCEKFLVTFNPNFAGVNDQALIIWDTRTGHKRRSFTCERSSNISWPFFRWNYDDSYFAKLAPDTLLVYETETFSLLDKKSIKIQHIKDFEWSPTNNYISYWVAEDKNVLARVVLLDIPSKNEIRSKNLVNVAECKMYWQSSGDYVCVRVDRYKKVNIVKEKEDEKDSIKYSGIYHNFEIFRIREKQIPVDSIEIKETFQAFGWEPNGQKFCIISSEGANRNTVQFRRIVSASSISPGKIEIMKEIKNKSYTNIYWSPQGQYCVLASIGPKNQGVPTADFYDVGNDVTLLNKMEHDHMSDIEWDPTGRYLVTYVSNWNWKADNAYIMWNFQGKQIQKQNYDRLFKFSWRPRPPTLLNEEHKKEIRKNFKVYDDKYSAMDKLYQSKVSKEILEKRRAMMKDFNIFKKISTQRYEEQRERRRELRNGYDTDALVNDDELIEYTVQFLVESKKEEVNE